MSLHSFIPNQKIESSKFNENFAGLADGSEIESGAITPDKMNFGAQTASVVTEQNTTSTSYTDLATVGPAVTVTVPASGVVLLLFSAKTEYDTATGSAFLGYALSGANTVVAADNDAIQHRVDSANKEKTQTLHRLLTGLTPGSTTFTLKYRGSGGNTAIFSRRHISVIPIGN